MQLVRLREADLLHEDSTIAEVLERAKVQKGPTLWLVIDTQHPAHLAGVLSPFELMQVEPDSTQRTAQRSPTTRRLRPPQRTRTTGT